jgi:hypothetical protein
MSVPTPKRRPIDIERTDESRVVSAADRRSDPQFSRRAQKAIWKHIQQTDNPIGVALLALHESGGWDRNMLRALTGKTAANVTASIESARESLPKSLRTLFDHAADSYCAISLEDAETLLRVFKVGRPFIGDDPALDAAIDELRNAYTRRRDGDG